MRKTAVAVAGGALAVMLMAPAAHAATTASSTEWEQSRTLHHCCHRHYRDRDRDYRDRDYRDRDYRDGGDREWDDRDDREDGGWDGWHCHQGVLGRLVDYLL
jgi:hypothetical protein